MIPFSQLLLFAFAALAMALTPGPNMIYLVSRSLCQGATAAGVSLLGVALGFVLHLLLAAFGLTAFFLAVPFAYQALKYAGCAYLLWLAWCAVKPGGRGLFETRDLPEDSPLRLFWMGFLTNALNPKIAVFYVSIFTQFLDPARGSVLAQSLELGAVQIVISMTVNFTLIQSAGAVTVWLQQRPVWARVQRWLMATVLGGLAFRLAADQRR
jgi:threonine/homoserine/homoserine lactone efflux protein